MSQYNNIVIDYDLVQTNELENLLRALNTHINALHYNYGVKDSLTKLQIRANKVYTLIIKTKRAPLPHQYHYHELMEWL
jgi:hypothetical protein